MKILGLREEGTDPGISLNLIIFSHIKCILEMARNRGAWMIYKKKTNKKKPSLSNRLAKPL